MDYEFWESIFADKKEMWGFEPAPSAYTARDIFIKHSVRNILVPGFGYGRNARVLYEAGMSITGIEISQTAIDLARDSFGGTLNIYHGSVMDMPFDIIEYDGIYSHSLIHLLNETDRNFLLQQCFNQLSANGIMLFTMISHKSHRFGLGELVAPNTYELHKGAPIYFYTEAAINDEFGSFGLVSITEIEEDHPMYLVECHKNVSV